MEVTIKHRPSFALAVVEMAPNENVQVEPGAMVSYSDGITVETKMKGGLMGGLKRALAGEDFFQNRYQAPAQGGELTLAQALPGDMVVLPLEGQEFMLQSGAYMANEEGVEVDAKWGGAKGFFSSGSLIMLKLSGRGKLLAGCYGAVEERVLAAGQAYTVDTGHIVGFDASVQFEVKRAGSWKSTILGGEGLVVRLTGPGRVLMQTRSEGALIGWILPQIPQKSN
ncbi:MAG: TIGR00266 family protein [Anaerolineae bacterium]|nr:TIGR00266 family protein [Anaerolineae bacterium]